MLAAEHPPPRASCVVVPPPGPSPSLLVALAAAAAALALRVHLSVLVECDGGGGGGLGARGVTLGAGFLLPAAALPLTVRVEFAGGGERPCLAVKFAFGPHFQERLGIGSLDTRGVRTVGGGSESSAA